MIDWGSWALDNRKLVYFLLVVLTIGGLVSYSSMSKLEDPEIKVKQAAVLTIYPGASSHEVELEVSDKLEKSIRSLSQVKEVSSTSSADMSLLMVTLKTTLRNEEVDQAWDLLRRRVGDVQHSFPSGVQPSIVLDNFGDVYGIFYALQYQDYSNEEAAQYADLIAREVQKIDGISQVNIFGKQTQIINIDLYEDKMANLGILPAQVLALLKGRNEAIYSGYYEAGGQRLRLSISDRYRTVEDIGALMLQGSQGDQLCLRDIANISQGYEEPIRSGMRYDGERALGISISAMSGTDITQIGQIVEERIKHLEQMRLPAGMRMQKVFFQPERVHDALNAFVINLIESVLIVVLILVFFMGWRSGLILGFALFTTVIGSVLILNFFDGTLQRVSLASFILAMGMLVDNAIVILDGIQNNLERGVERRLALTLPGRQTTMPLLGATLIAILSFLPIYLSPDTTGIYVRDLFIVLAVSLLLSWVLALIMIPILSDKILHPKVKEQSQGAYSGRIYQLLERSIAWAIGHKALSVSIVGLLLISSGLVYLRLPQGFFPDMDYNQLYIEYRLPEGYTTKQVDKDLSEIESYLKAREGVEHITTSIGATPTRYNLVRNITSSSLNYGELIVDFSSPEQAIQSLDSIQSYLSTRYPSAQVRVKRYNLMFKEYPIELEFRGPDPEVLRSLAKTASNIMRHSDSTLMARIDWSPRVAAVQVDYDQPQALSSGLTRRDIGVSLMTATYGLPVGTFYEGTERKGLNIRTVDQDGQPIEHIDQAAIFSALPSLNVLNRNSLQGLMTGAVNREDMISSMLQTKPLSGVTKGVSLVWEEPTIHRSNGERAIKAQCTPITGVSNEALRKSLAPRLEQIQLSEGYSMSWGGEKAASEESMQYLFRFYPLAIILMIAILIMLFKDYRKPLIVFLCLPTIAIGAMWGMYVSGKTFGFTAIVAMLGLVGMMIKNVIVLLDEVNLLISQGLTPYKALIQSSQSRMRPVMLASLTTILGMLPLLSDALFGPLAVVVMSGLLVGTIATLVFTPLLYAILFAVQVERTTDRDKAKHLN